MNNNFLKNGVLNTPNIYEPGGGNLAKNLGKGSWSYTPTTGTNSCLAGERINMDTSITGKHYVECDISWNGFDKSNTSGTFDIWFQGAVNDAWKMSNPATSVLGHITSIVLASTSGTKHFSTTFDYNDTSKLYFDIGFRSDYSNGKGSITLSNVKVIPAKYYNSKTEPSTRIIEDGLATGEIIEY